MTADQIKVIKMLRTVYSFLNKNVDVIASSAAIMASKSALEAQMLAINDNVLVQYVDNTGYAEDKKIKRKQVEDKAQVVSVALCSHASLTANDSLRNDAYFAPSTLRLASAYKLVGIASHLAGLLELHLNNVLPLGIAPQLQSDFSAAIAAFSESINKPSDKIEGKKRATAAIAKQLSDVRQFLKSNLDIHIRVLKFSQPRFVALYFSARVIGKTRHRKPDALLRTIDAGTGNPVSKAKIEVMGTKLVRYSGKQGRNVFMKLNDGLCEIAVSHPDYESQTMSFTIEDKKTVKCTIALVLKQQVKG